MAPRLRSHTSPAYDSSDSESEQAVTPLPLLTPVKSAPVDVGVLERTLRKLRRDSARSAQPVTNVPSGSHSAVAVASQGAGTSTDQSRRWC